MGARVPGIRDVPHAAQTEGRRRPMRDGHAEPATDRVGCNFACGAAMRPVTSAWTIPPRLDRTAWTSS